MFEVPLERYMPGSDDLHVKMHEIMVNVQAHLEMMAAAYLKATDIPIEEVELVVRTEVDGVSYHFRRLERREVG